MGSATLKSRSVGSSFRLVRTSATHGMMQLAPLAFAYYDPTVDKPLKFTKSGAGDQLRISLISTPHQGRQCMRIARGMEQFLSLRHIKYDGLLINWSFCQDFKVRNLRCGEGSTSLYQVNATPANS